MWLMRDMEEERRGELVVRGLNGRGRWVLLNCSMRDLYRGTYSLVVHTWILECLDE